MNEKQKKIGNYYEVKLLDLLRKKGWWCHLFSYSANGQPCDIVAIKNNIGILIDVKHCATDKFDMSRIEPNQWSCFDYAKICGVQHTGFAVWFDSEQEFKWIPFKRITKSEKNIDKRLCKSLEAVLDEISIF